MVLGQNGKQVKAQGICRYYQVIMFLTLDQIQTEYANKETKPKEPKFSKHQTKVLSC